MEIAICDSDRVWVGTLKMYVSDFFNHCNTTDYTIYEYDCGEDMLKDNRHVDIAFLDVELPGMSGLEVVRRLNGARRNVITFIITSHDGYLDEAMDLGVFRYINKPVDKSVINLGLNRAMRLMHGRGNKTMLVECEEGNMVIDANSIICVESLGRKCILYTESGIFTTGFGIRHWKEKLNADIFFMSNKSYIVNISRVKGFNNDGIMMHGMEEMALLSRERRKEFRERVILYIDQKESGRGR